jgi:uncharacterized protein YyaL (SSP411 family)/aryl-alcohol dehydrogenase-like predicted oxidoreductase
MAATVAMNRGQGGWPMTVFITPDLEPVFAGTYFPPVDMHGRPGFPTIIREITRAWRDDREALRTRASEFAEHLRQQGTVGNPLAVGASELRGALAQYKQEFDAQYGGFGDAPKFPPAVGLSLLLRLHKRFGDPQALVMVRRTLEAMAIGGMYDHVGGGFARYSTDRRWLVPHFEKMLYDNALLAKVYLEGYQATGDEFCKRVAAETLDYVLREMTSPDGGLYSSTDADSEGEEGKFFVWTPEQIAEVLDETEARCFCAYYDITLAGNWEGVSIPNTPRSLSIVAEQLDVAPAELEATLERAREKVYAARERRVKPGLDDKILTSWNGLMIGALADGYRVLGDVRYLEAAERAAEFVLGTLSREDGGLLRTYRAGKAHLDGYLEDYAYLSEGLLDLYEAGGKVGWLREAERTLEHSLTDFLDEETGAFYSTARDHERLLMRCQDGSDGATPAANAVAAHTLARISYHLDRPDLRHAAVRALKAFGSLVARYPRGFAKSLCAVDFLLDGPVELAFVGRAGSDDLEPLQREVARHYLPNRIQALLDPESPAGAEELPLLAGKALVDEKPALYICRDFACQAPVTEPDAVQPQLESAEMREPGGATIAIRLPGAATPEGTARYSGRFDATGFAKVGSSGLMAGRLGFGGYRVHDMAPEHREALKLALRFGVNLVDTSTNYTEGASERLIGSALRELIDAGELSRDEVIVVSKIGYVQGSNLGSAQERESSGRPYPEMVKYDDGLWHCIHPEFLDAQLDGSLDRLELETLDFCLLHNPEYFLSDAARSGRPPEQAREEFFRRLKEAFAYLETQVEEGRIAGYGVSSNTAGSPASDIDSTSLARVIAAAKEAGGADHHFRVLQLPLNLLEAEAAFERKDGEDSARTVLEVALEHDIAVLVNRPLNAFVRNTLVRLADVEVDEAPSHFDEQLDRLADLEFMFHSEIAPELSSPVTSAPLDDVFRMADNFRQLHQAGIGLAHWSQIEAQIKYSVGTIASAIDLRVGGETADRWAEWRESYLAEVDDLLLELQRQAAHTSEAYAANLSAALDPALPPDRRTESLSRKALWTVMSTPGVTCVLNGMRTAAYVDDSLAVLGWGKLDSPERVYEAAKAAFDSLGT